MIPSEEPLPAHSPHPVESFGRFLRQERELRGIALEQIADETRIGVANLRALEQDDSKRLPSGAFLRGYIRAYAQAIGLDPDEASLRFEERAARDRPAAEPARRRELPRAALVVVLAVGVLLLTAAASVWLLR